MSTPREGSAAPEGPGDPGASAGGAAGPLLSSSSGFTWKWEAWTCHGPSSRLPGLQGRGLWPGAGTGTSPRAVGTSGGRGNKMGTFASSGTGRLRTFRRRNPNFKLAPWLQDLSEPWCHPVLENFLVDVCRQAVTLI